VEAVRAESQLLKKIYRTKYSPKRLSNDIRRGHNSHW
jgi:hypothetical protein